MWGWIVEEVRRAGPRKVIVFIIAATIAVLLAYGVNSTNDAANSQTLPSVTHHAALIAPTAANRHR